MRIFKHVHPILRNPGDAGMPRKKKTYGIMGSREMCRRSLCMLCTYMYNIFDQQRRKCMILIVISKVGILMNKTKDKTYIKSQFKIACLCVCVCLSVCLFCSIMNEKEKTSAEDLFRVEATSANYFVHQPVVKVKTR